MSSAPPPLPPPKRERVKNFLLYGFLISIALHLIVGPFVKFQRPPDEQPEKVETVQVERMPTPPPTPKPTPKPTPPPTPTPPPRTPPPATPHPQPPQQIKINTLQQNSKSQGGPSEETNQFTQGSTQGVPEGAPSGPATTVPVVPTATPAPPPPTPTPLACADPNVPPRTVSAFTPETPPLAQQQGITGEVQVVVTLDESSRQTTAPVVVKTPSKILNQAAIDAARQSKFQTEIKDCKPQASKYIFVVEFESQ